MSTHTLTEEQWQTAHAIAKSLVETDVNELKKAIAYLRAYGNEQQAGFKFFTYLKILVNNGDRIGHSNQTKTHYKNIEKACKHHLQSYQTDVTAMLQILGWTARLMRYYKTTPLSESSAMPKEASTLTVSNQQQSFTIGQVLEAKVNKIKGKKVTYEMLNSINLTVKEPKRFAVLQEGQLVKVEIIDLKEDGSIKKVKGID